jgi:hypothetical protein
MAEEGFDLIGKGNGRLGFGMAPGRIVFVTFHGDKAIKVKEFYAGLGAEAAPSDR